jgi:hypothetical protein
MDPEVARPLLERLAGKLHEGAAVVSLLVIIGDDQSFQVLRTLWEQGKGLGPMYGDHNPRSWLTVGPEEWGRAAGEYLPGGRENLQPLKTLLELGPDQRPERWRRQELLYWQALKGGGLFPTMVGRRGYLHVAYRLQHHGLRFTPEFLRTKLPDLLAMAIAGVQKEASLIPDLERIAAGGRRDREKTWAKEIAEVIEGRRSMAR